MSDLEIARRCLACGASVRARANFCPQCGRSMNEATKPSAYSSTPQEENGRPADVKRAGGDGRTIAPTKEKAPLSNAPLTAPVNRARAAETANARKNAADTQREPPAKRRHSGAIEENLRPRVDKLREASNVALDEASDDPGLRFVLVAAVLFIFFLFLLIISNFLW